MHNIVQAICLAAIIGLLSSACATKDWVREYVGVQAADTNRNVARVEEKYNDGAQRLERRVAEEAQRTDNLGARMTTAEKSIGEIGGNTRTAGDQATTALRKAEASDSRLTSLWASRDKRTPVDTREIAFGFDRSKLDDTAETALVALVKELKENPKLSVALVGFTDPVGPREYNLQLSQRRVEAVQRYLVEHDVELWRIHTVGLGPLAARDIPNKQKRRVTVMLMTSE